MVRKAIKQSNIHINKYLISYTNPHSAIAAEYRAISNHMKHTSGGSRMKSLVITSPSFREGKTMATINLAVSKAQYGEKVLIIDANIRNPTIHKVFNTNINPGLTNVLTGQTTLVESIYHTGIARLDILSFGTMLHNAMEFVDSKLMDDLLEMVTAEYDYVLIDTAPVLDVLDTNTIASKCDGVVLVLNRGKTQSESALRAKRSLEFFPKTKIVGVIINNKR